MVELLIYKIAGCTDSLKSLRFFKKSEIKKNIKIILKEHKGFDAWFDNTCDVWTICNRNGKAKYQIRI